MSLCVNLLPLVWDGHEKGRPSVKPEARGKVGGCASFLFLWTPPTIPTN